MSIDPSDSQYDDFVGQIYNDFREHALDDFDLYERVVGDFKQSRLRDYYLENPMVAENAKSAATEARSLLVTHPRASLVLSWTATEVGLRKAIFTPILHGSFHTESSTKLVELVIGTKNKELITVFLRILAQHTGIDLHECSRPDSRKTIWEEMEQVKKMRHAILHQAASASSVDAIRAIKVADFLLGKLFPEVLFKLGLHLHDEVRVCGSRKCLPD